MNKEQIIEAIESMTVLELSELVKALEEKFGVSAAAPVAVAAAPAAGGAAGLAFPDAGVLAAGDNAAAAFLRSRQLAGFYRLLYRGRTVRLCSDAKRRIHPLCTAGK